MGRALSYTILFVSAVGLTVISVAEPSFLSDSNGFLKNFVNENILNMLGVILAITLASVANIHLAFNRIEERYEKPLGLAKSRTNLKKAAYWLIGIFVAGCIIVAVKPVAAVTEVGQAIFNSAALLMLIWHVLILISLTELVFKIGPEHPPGPK
ncbi:hypothetical protein [Pseudorhizobium pelagicum]|uniref:Uncharacterized protein n=1 Tax=Pseudorhizobium pelagicum TaxID=1509405 RepID=A0A922P135_9HYPH|nr:hypothetical protein [Pseudorhizobium pelagicum]KEQ05105.1 hypothetical protein GV67_06720 [Pseudorhizobium pelagicum]KEQ07618.1 hypothetical protein GV68_04685 [Pseudorhizobium pelagicum]